MIFHIAEPNFTLSLSPLFTPDNFVLSASGFVQRSAIPWTPLFLSTTSSLTRPPPHPSPASTQMSQHQHGSLRLQRLLPERCCPTPLWGGLTINSAMMRDGGATSSEETGEADADVIACCRAGSRSLQEALHRSRYYTQLRLVPHPQPPRAVCTAALLLERNLCGFNNARGGRLGCGLEIPAAPPRMRRQHLLSIAVCS